MNTQQIIQQEAAIYDAMRNLLPTIGMLANKDTNPGNIQAAINDLLTIQNVQPQFIAALQDELSACILRVITAHAASQPG